ncbi:MAG: endonuclease Q family protein [Candidatus Anstonellales archaeon]
MDIENLAYAAKMKGISLLGSGDFTHPLQFREIKEMLVFNDGIAMYNGIYFILSVEVSNVFNIENKTYKVHTVILSPSLDIAEQINETLSKHGNLSEDGRPTLNYSTYEMNEELKAISRDIALIPAHIWTPWFSLFGAHFGADDINELYPDDSLIIALETGLSSDPLMNWMVSKIDKYTLVSNSDAHSLENLGREGNKIRLKQITYKEIVNGIRTGNAMLKTYEYFPQEGKYFNDGHRKCNINLSPEEAEKIRGICPVCKRKLTIGVMHRIKKMADRKYGEKKPNWKGYQHIIPLKQVIAKVKNKTKESKTVQSIYNDMISYFGNEFAIYEANENDLLAYTDKDIANALIKIKKEQVYWKPGYDGVFGEFFLNGNVENKNKQEMLKRWFDEV